MNIPYNSMSNEAVKNIAVIYGRFSSSMQKDESIETQIEKCKEYAEKNGLTVIKIYVDKAKTGTTSKRTSFNELMRDSAKMTFGKVLIYKIDRFARNLHDYLMYERDLYKNGVEIVSVSQPFSNRPEDIVLKALLVAQAEYYSVNLAQDVSNNKKTHVRAGKYSGGNTPYGYDKVDGKFIVNEYEAKVVRMLFNMYASGHGYQNICKHLLEQGIRTKRNKVFQKEAVANILKNEIYIGKFTYNKVSKVMVNGIKKKTKNPKSEWIVLDNIFEPIIDTTLFDTCQNLIRSYRTQSKQKRSKHNFFLTGKCKCGHCNYSFTGASYNNSGGTNIDYTYYRCTSTKKNIGTVCNNKMIRSELLEQFILNTLRNKIYTNKLIEKYANDIAKHFNSNEESTKGKVDKLKKDLETLMDEQSELVRMKIKKQITERFFTQENELYEKQINETNALISELSINTTDLYSVSSIKSYLHKIKKGLTKLNNKETIKEFIQNTVDKIVVYEDKVDIYFYAFKPPNDDGYYFTSVMSKVNNEGTGFTIDKTEYSENNDKSIATKIVVDRCLFDTK